jgi:hypothetical protein
MSWTKRQFVLQAFDEIGLASYAYDLTPEQFNSALVKLDAMMATWNGYGIRLGYPLPSSPGNSTESDATGVPDSANEAIYTNLAVRIAPGYGKVISPDTKATAKNSYNLLLLRANAPLEMQYPDTLPVGAGNKPTRVDTPFMRQPVEPLLAGQDGPIEFD